MKVTYHKDDDDGTGCTGCLVLFILFICLFVTCDSVDKLGNRVKKLEESIEFLENEIPERLENEIPSKSDIDSGDASPERPGSEAKTTGSEAKTTGSEAKTI